MPDYWLKQTKDQPLFPELIWSRPENRRHAGKLLIIGGNGYEFKAPANAYGGALEAGVGQAKVILPNSMEKTVSAIFPEAEFAPSTRSGSFAERALDPFLTLASWADGVLLAGDIGKNSETQILLEKFLGKFTGQVTLAGDSVDYFFHNSEAVVDRAETSLIINFSQLQKLAVGSGFAKAFISSHGLAQFVEILHEFSKIHEANFVVNHLENTFVAVKGKVSSTVTRFQAARPAATAVWWLQNPTQPFEAITASAA